MSKKSKLLNLTITAISATLFVAAVVGVFFCSYAAILFIPALIQAFSVASKRIKHKLTNNFNY